MVFYGQQRHLWCPKFRENFIPASFNIRYTIIIQSPQLNIEIKLELYTIIYITSNVHFHP